MKGWSRIDKASNHKVETGRGLSNASARKFVFVLRAPEGLYSSFSRIFGY